MNEDRFFSLAQIQRIVSDFEALKIGVVLALHHTDPQWRRQYRSSRPELEGWMWSMRLHETMFPMPAIKQLIEVCERHSLTFWMSSGAGGGDEGNGPAVLITLRALAATEKQA